MLFNFFINKKHKKTKWYQSDFQVEADQAEVLREIEQQ